MKPRRDALKIRADYLTCLERNDHAALPAMAYTIGFVRSYAAYVGLEPGDLAHRFSEEAGRSSVRQDYMWLKPVERGRFSGSLAAARRRWRSPGAAYVGWYYRTADARKPAAAVDIVRIQPAPPGDVAAADAGGCIAPDPG